MLSDSSWMVRRGAVVVTIITGIVEWVVVVAVVFLEAEIREQGKVKDGIKCVDC